MINIKVNGVNYEVESNKNILEVLRSLSFKIPSLCFLKNINNNASCRLCLVLDNKSKKLITSCSNNIYDGLDISTNDERVLEAVKTNLSLLADNHNADCDNCLRKDNCVLKSLCEEYKVELKERDVKAIDSSLDSIVRDPSKCILCGRCTQVCQNIQKIGCIGKSDRGDNTVISVAYNKSLKDSGCISCGQCTLVCPTGAVTEKSEIDKVITALNSNKYVVVATAPSIRYSLGEYFGYDFGENVSKKMVTAFKKIGFKKVFDLNFGADLTVIEEVAELIKRLNTKKGLPMFTSCCPSWVNYINKYHPELKENLSSAKSPQQMMGSVIKTFYAEKNNINPSDIYVVMAMPCVAKKLEKTLYDNYVDATLTTREVSILFKNNGIDLKNIDSSEFDSPLGEGNSEIFGTSGGVMISALRTFVNATTKESIKNFDLIEIKDLPGSFEYKQSINGIEYKFAIINGIGNVKMFINDNKHLNYNFIEVMGCPSGCINGGGQAIIDNSKHDRETVILKRASAMKKTDSSKDEFDSKENINIMNLYKEYFKAPGSDFAEEILHTKKEAL